MNRFCHVYFAKLNKFSSLLSVAFIVYVPKCSPLDAAPLPPEIAYLPLWLSAAACRKPIASTRCVARSEIDLSSMENYSARQPDGGRKLPAIVVLDSAFANRRAHPISRHWPSGAIEQLDRRGERGGSAEGCRVVSAKAEYTAHGHQPTSLGLLAVKLQIKGANCHRASWIDLPLNLENSMGQKEGQLLSWTPEGCSAKRTANE